MRKFKVPIAETSYWNIIIETPKKPTEEEIKELLLEVDLEKGELENYEVQPYNVDMIEEVKK